MTSAHTATSDGGTDWVALLISYWWVILIFGGAILEFLGETFDVGLSALHRRSKMKHKRKLQALRLELEIAQARSGASGAALVKPGPCVHRRVRQVRDRAMNWSAGFARAAMRSCPLTGPSRRRICDAWDAGANQR